MARQRFFGPNQIPGSMDQRCFQSGIYERERRIIIASLTRDKFEKKKLGLVIENKSRFRESEMVKRRSGLESVLACRTINYVCTYEIKFIRGLLNDCLCI